MFAWPLSDARCSGVHLFCKATPKHDGFRMGARNTGTGVTVLGRVRETQAQAYLTVRGKKAC
eukprot:119263-Chlamydomonas_euryale.AAC.1